MDAATAIAATTAPDEATVTPAAVEVPKPEPKAEPVPEPRRFKVKVDGQEQEVDEAELLKGYQRASAANKRFEEALKAKQETEALLANIKGNTREALRRAGIDPTEYAKQEILARIEEEKRQAEEQTLPPAVRQALEEKRAMEKELAQMKAEREAHKTATLQGEAKAHFDRWNQELPKAMETAGLPRTPEAARLVLQKMQVQIKSGLPADPLAAAQIAAEELQARNFSILGKLSPEQIVKALGKDTFDALLRHSIAQAKQPQATAPAPAAAPKKGERGWLDEREGTRFWTG